MEAILLLLLIGLALGFGARILIAFKKLYAYNRLNFAVVCSGILLILALPIPVFPKAMLVCIVTFLTVASTLYESPRKP